MHIPNGYLTDPVCAASTAASLAALGIGLAKLRKTNAETPHHSAAKQHSAALMAATGAGIFAAQMLNVPIASGTSGHLIGAALAAVLLGPWRGMLTMTVVLCVQCFVFGDGGVTALGANVLNMAVVATLAASAINAAVISRVAGPSGHLLAVTTAAFGSVLAAAAMCSLELAASGHVQLLPVLSAMLGTHALVGIGEAAIMVAALACLESGMVRGLFAQTEHSTFGGALIAACLVAAMAPLASQLPDGLERVAADLQFASAAGDSWSLLPEYAAPGIGWPALAVVLAGLIGVALVSASTYWLGHTAVARVRKH
ncbi:MAG TPA: energy-coupling factor ABC transporter permease [Pirellulales bacterium]